jgi:hypothetical protein
MDEETNDNRYKENLSIPPRFFQHVDLFRTFEAAKEIDQIKLLNLINHLHFTGNPLYILLKHPIYQNSLLVKAYPEPCHGSQLTCRWDESYFQYNLKSHLPLCLVIINNPFMIITSFNLLQCDNDIFSLQLPEISYALNQRHTQRYFCKNISAELMQSDFVASGELVDFSPTAFRVKAGSETHKHHCWFNPDVPLSVRLFSNEVMIYSEFCKCIRWQDGPNISTEFVFASENQHISRFPAKKIRNPRRKINPPLTAVFEHPFIKKKLQRDIFDISSTGFSIRNKPDEEIFFPGLTIPQLSFHIAGIPIANCVAQIIYRRIVEDDIQYGFAILDMDIHSYSRINHVLGINSDPKISISTEVDMDALWDFFFQTGFIYPEKYGLCQAHRNYFTETYRKLYQENPEIARHITYNKNGRIYGHISMIRAYERTWLLHHHASRPTKSMLNGFAVLRQMMYFTHGMYQLPSARMDYVISYFRPENKFPDRVFGGFARDFNNPQACSLDLFTYLTLPATCPELDFPPKWCLRACTPHDFWELGQFYKHHSGGLLLNILRSGYSDSRDETLEKVFERLGFLRRYRIYSLMFEDQLKAVFIVDQSDLAINMSNLLNCIKVLTIDPLGLLPEMLSIAVSKLGSVYNLDKISLLLYPAITDKSACISYEKRYQLWIGDMRYMNQFMDYVHEKFRMNYD